MRVRIHPSQAHGSIKIPPSKSMAHRAVICAGLAGGQSVISSVAFSDDVKASIDAIKHIGATVNVAGDTLTIEGTGGAINYSGESVDCRESGSTLRFVIPLFSLSGEAVRFTGAKRLFERPHEIYRDLFRSRGLEFTQDGSGIGIKGRLSAGIYEIDGNVSSQFISGLLFTLPLLDGDSEIRIRPPFESASYVKLTLEMLSIFGIVVDDSTPLLLRIKGGQKYNPASYSVEGDYSQLAFMAVLATINGDITCTGLNLTSSQGDKAIISILERAGAAVRPIDGGFHIRQSKICASEIDLADCPDLGPILTALAIFGEGTSRIYNAGRLRYKESDRIGAMEQELRKLGVDIRTTADTITIAGKSGYAGGIELEGHNDHRIVMSLAVAATRFDAPTIINGAEAVNKSYPGFFEDLEKLNVKIEYL